MKKITLMYPFFLLALLTAGCGGKNVDPQPEDEKELITTVVLRLDPEGKGQSMSAAWRDTDGPGGQNPVIENLILKANTTYTGTLTFLNESNSNQPQDLTAEIRDEGHDHDVFYIATGANVTFVKTDIDQNNRPIGLETTATVTAPSTGTLRIVLKHQPGLKTANSTIETGETDVDVTFPVVVQD